jgi:hypothetical protein
MKRGFSLAGQPSDYPQEFDKPELNGYTTANSELPQRRTI